MCKIRRILFPIDYSTDCHALAPTVRKMIEYWNADATLLHVVDPYRTLGQKHELQRLIVQKAAIAGETLPFHRICCRLESGAAGDRIVEYSRSRDFDLVLVSAGGSTSLYGHPIGKVADQVLSEAPCPVWLDWGSARSRATAGMYARRVACVLALGESDEYILREATDLTEDLEAQLTVIHALSSVPGNSACGLHDVRKEPQNLAFVRRHFERLRRRVSPCAEMALEVGSRHSVIRSAIQTRQTGLLVTGNWRETILAAEAECPVLRLATPVAAGAHIGVSLPQYAAVLRKSA